MKKSNGLETLRRKQRRGVGDEYSSTCFVAAIQGVSDRHEIPDDTFEDYEEAYWTQYFQGVNTKQTRRTIRQVLREAGGASFKGLSEKRIRNARECQKILDNARKGGRRVIIYTLKGHAVGLRPVSGGWRMVGSWTPVPSDKILSSKDIFEYLYVPSKELGRRRPHGKLPANILTLNPEKKK